MPIFKVPVDWCVYGVCIVEALNLEEAINKVENDETPYPTISNNTEESLEVNFELIEELNPGYKLRGEPLPMKVATKKGIREYVEEKYGHNIVD